MTDSTTGILAEAKKNRFSSIKDTLSEDDIAAVWENVSTFIEKQMGQQKGVQIPSLGTFIFSQKKLDIGNNKFILIQRPVFNISEKLAQSQGLQYVKHHVPGHIPVVQLNYAAMSFESPFDRDTVENCVREILGAAQRAVGSRRNVELNFTGIGKLTIRDSKVKMKFFKEFINQMDGSGQLLDSLQNRPGTVDSVMSDRSISRAGSSNTVVLPKDEEELELLSSRRSSSLKMIDDNRCLSEIDKYRKIFRISKNNHNATTNLAPVAEQNEDYLDNNPGGLPPATDLPGGTVEAPVLPGQHPVDSEMFHPSNLVSTEEGMNGADDEDVYTAAAIRNIENAGEPPAMGQAGPTDTLRTLNMDTEPEPRNDPPKRASIPPSRLGSRMAAPMAMATGVSLLDDLVPSAHTPKSAPSLASRRGSPPPGDFLHKPSPPTQLAPLHRSVSFDAMKPGEHVHTPPGSSCGHPNAGQELCYLCHQRARRNVPVSFMEERKRREEEEDRLLQQYQYMKDAENVLGEQEVHMAKRHDLQKMAAFNLGVSEALHHKKRSRDTEFHRSYIFQRRPLTPPRIIKQTEYSGDLAKQVDQKDSTHKKRRADEEFLERLEQVQLAEDLAIQREQFLQEKADETEKYKKALETQIQINTRLAQALENPAPSYGRPNPAPSATSVRLPFIPQAKTLRPFSDPGPSPARLSENWKPFFGRLRFKPLQLPPREPDTEVFGKNDMTNEKMAERRRRAYDLFQDQQDLVAQKKREAILKRLAEQKEEEQVLDRTKHEMLEDRANRFHRRTHARERLEQDWARALTVKNDRLEEDRIRALSPGVLLHEQCDKYHRCDQCKRNMKNCGESNLWSESRYIPGSRLMV